MFNILGEVGAEQKVSILGLLTLYSLANNYELGYCKGFFYDIEFLHCISKLIKVTCHIRIILICPWLVDAVIEGGGAMDTSVG